MLHLQNALLCPIATLVSECHTGNCIANVQQYTQWLKNQGIVPNSASFQGLTLQSICEKSTPITTVVFRCHHSGISREYSFSGILHSAISAFKDRQIGLCMDCINDGPESKEQGKCRKPHP